MQTQINSLLIGKVESFGPKGQQSAYRKKKFDSSIAITTLGLQGDEQADLTNHGGEDKALLHYAYDHYAYWQKQKPQHVEHLRQPGAFGENISTLGFTEETVCIGDSYQIGTAKVEISQGRQPCWKLGHRFNDSLMVRAVVETGRCGWYYRVLVPGAVCIGDSIQLLQRPNPQWTVSRVFKLLIAGENDLNSITELSELSQLSEHWRIRALKLLTKS